MHRPARSVTLVFAVVLGFLVLAAPQAMALSNGVVISQVYAGAGCGTANCSAYRNDYIELFNRGSVAVSLNGWSVQYASAAGTSWTVAALPNFTLQPGQYFLFGQTGNANGVLPLPATDGTGPLAMGATAGKVALVNSATALTVTAPATCPTSATIVDMVAYGTTATCFEGGGPTPAPSTSNAVFRGSNGCTETDSNNTDFAAAAAAPRNSSTTLAPCAVADTAPSVSSTTPTNGATGVVLASDLTVTFSEAVNVTGNWFQVACASSGTRNVADTVVSGGPTTFTINPNVDFAASESCTVTVFAAQVTDQDANDPPDNMAANYVFSFTALSPFPNLTINDISLAEGNSGTTTFTFTVSLSAPAGAGGVTFDIATADGTATQPSDYTLKSLTGQTIPAGSSTYTFDVLVNGDTTAEPNETFFVNVTNVTNAIPTDGQGLGTITNDDFTRIHDIQGPGASSPIVGASVTTRGIVTGVRSNGFYIQEPDATVDADPATSEGIYVFTNSAPPAAAAVGNLVQVTGTVAEYVPSADPQQPPLTEITSPAVVLVSSGNPLPSATPLTATFPDPAGPFDQLERVEGMRVSVASMTVVAPTMGSVNEANATGSSNGTFYGVVTGVARPFREAGIRPSDAPPTGSIPPIPRWDGNPELLSVDSDGLAGTTLVNVSTGATIANVVGPLDYTFRYYRILPEATLVPTGGKTPTAAAIPAGSEFTVASYNLERFFDTTNDPGITEPVLTATAFNNRLTKASLQVRNYLRTPDVLGVVEVENLTTLQALATQINNDAVAASQPNPLYTAYLVEGNDVGGIDVGFLVKTAPVVGATPRVTVNSVTQYGLTTTYVNPNTGASELLNDRPPLLLDAVVNHANGATFPVTVIVNHLRSMNGVDDPTPSGTGTEGARVRAKRNAQAEYLANLIQGRQTATPAERIIAIGDFNAFDVNDGYVHMMGTIGGTPVPDNETVVVGDGADLVSPDLVNLVNTPPAAERYGYSFDGSAQNIDHVLVNGQVVSGTLARRIEHPRVNVDFPETDRSVYGASVTRLSDHEPVVSYFQVAAFLTADLSVTKTDSPDPVVAGTNLTWTITATNNGPDPAASAALSDTLPAGTTFVSLSSPGGWSCTTPAVGATGTVACSNASFAVGSAVFTLTAAVDPGVAGGATISNTATVSSTTADGTPGNNSATATTTVATQADLAVTLGDSPDPVIAGNGLTWTSGLTNNGPSVSAPAAWSLPLPAGTAFASLSAPGGWSCTTPAVGANGTVSCTIASLAPATAGTFTVVAATNPALAGGATITATAGVSSGTTDPNAANDSASATTSVNASSGVAIAATASPEPVTPGGALAWTVTLTNSGPSAATNVTWSDALPAGTTFTSLNPAAGWSCTTPAAGTIGTVSCSLASFPVGTAVFTINGAVNAATLPGTAITNTAAITAVTGDSDPGDNSSSFVSNVASPAALSATKAVSGTGAPGATLTYTIVLHNTGTGAQFDNPGDELVDVLPSTLTLVSATASSGTAVATVATNTVTWNGSVPAGGSVTVTITATISASATVGQVVSNQATVSYDADGNGSNESSTLTDDPSTGAVGDATALAITRGAGADAVVPTLGGLGLAALALLVALGGALVLGRRIA